MQVIYVHRKFLQLVVTLRVMRDFENFLGAWRGCADFRDPTAVFRFKPRMLLWWPWENVSRSKN